MQQVSCSILSWTSENLSVNAFNYVFFYTEGRNLDGSCPKERFQTGSWFILIEVL